MGMERRGSVRWQEIHRVICMGISTHGEAVIDLRRVAVNRACV